MVDNKLEHISKAIHFQKQKDVLCSYVYTALHHFYLH